MNWEKIKKYYLENRLKCDCTILAILFFVNCFFEGFGYFICLVIATMVILEDRKNGFSIIVFCFPFVGIEGLMGLAYLLGDLTIFIIKQYIILYFIDKKKVNYITLSALLVFVIYGLLPIGEYNIQVLIKILAVTYLFVLVNLFIRYGDIFNLKFNVNVMAIGLIISSAYFLTYFISPFIHDKVLWTMGEDFIRFTAFFTNPNILAMVCEICLAFLTFYLLQDKFEWTDIIAYIIFAVVGLATFSKMFLVLFSIMFAILLVYTIKRYKLKSLWGIVPLLLAIMFAFIFKGDFFLAYVRRFFGGWDSDMNGYEKFLDIATTGRYKLWTTVLDYTISNPDVLFFGRGLGAPLIASMSAHNFYISMLYQLGIVGSLIFISLIVVLVLAFKKEHPQAKVSKAICVPVIIFALIMCAEDLFMYIY